MTMLPDDAGSKDGGARRSRCSQALGVGGDGTLRKRGGSWPRATSVESVCAVARRYGLAHTQIFTWRRELRRPAPELGEQMFVPVTVEPASAGLLASPKPKPVRRRRERGIELEIGGVTVRVAQGADRRTLETVLRAVKAERLSPASRGRRLA